MAKFITGKDLETVIYDIIWKAEETLLIVSPYIKLDEYFKKLFDKQINNPKIHLLIVFGKNEKYVSKSLSKDDFDYFKKFLNISIVYVPNLHAKYYGNENEGVVTSINLHDHSFKNNIEFGMHSEVSLLNKFTTTADQNAWEKCWEIAEENEAIFIKRPVFEKKLFSKNYIKSDILHDVTDQFYSDTKQKKDRVLKKIGDFEDEIELGSETTTERPIREELEKPLKGYCIRTKEEIPFNIQKPYCEKAYKSWAQYKNPNYKEKYCHKTGKESNGLTSMKKPIL